MLEVVKRHSPDEKKLLFAEVNPDRDSWIVSDLQSKWHLQKELIQRRGVLEQTAVMRASELWQRFAFQVAPELRPLSAELAQTLFWDWIQEMELPWARSPHAVPVVLNQMKMWMSIFCDPNHEEIMSQWFEANQESYVRWGHWFELCSLIWNRCREQSYMMTAWLPAVLLTEDLSRLQWRRTLTFDLGPQVSQVEGQLIKELGRHMDVRVVYPEVPWLALMKNTLKPYESLLDENNSGSMAWQPTVEKSFAFGRYSTQLAEVKDAVAQVRLWLEQGAKPHSIAIVAPDIEEYWPSLRLYLKEEGIAVAKPETAKLGGFLEMAEWMSTLRTASARVNTSDLEVYFFARKNAPKLSFNEFRVLFSHVYDSTDFQRAAHLFASDEAPSATDYISVEEFLGWSLRYWDPDAEQSRLFSLLQVIGQEVPRSLKLKPSQWLSYLEGLLARRECTLQSADESGVWCVSLTSADWLPVERAIFLNLNEGALRSIENSPVSSAEGQRIFTDTGYALGTTDRQELEFEFLWFLKKNWQELRLCFSATDFQGKVLTPSKLWMWAGFISEQLKHHPEAPRLTRWDELQMRSIEELGIARRYSTDRVVALKTALARDTDISVNEWGRLVPERLSASSLDRYWACPFIFASERQFKLSDDPALDLDLDRRTRGVLLHGILERLGAEPFRATWSDEEICQLIEEVKVSEKVQLGEERLWPAIRDQHLRLARQFLTFEHQWRERFPHTKTIGRELAFDVAWGETRMVGRIDRVDTDSQGRYAVIDYKASSGSVRNWKSWLANHDVQMALYTMLIENGQTDLPPANVVAANYYVVKEMDRRKGFHLKDETSELYSSKDRHYNFISENEKSELLSTVRATIDQALMDITGGRLNPQPEDIKICSGCSWRTLCRAPHLN